MLLPPVPSLVNHNTADSAVATVSQDLPDQPFQHPLERYVGGQDEPTIQVAQALRASLEPREFSLPNSSRSLGSSMRVTAQSQNTHSWVPHELRRLNESSRSGSSRLLDDDSTIHGSSLHPSSVVPSSEYDDGSSAPSLTHGGSSHNSSSVSTGIGRNIRHGATLDLEGQIIPRDPTNLQCCFQWRGCEGQFRYMDQFREHTLSHWYPHEPPNFFDCPLCEFQAGIFQNGFVAWEERLNHLAHHHIQGHDLSTARPEPKLIRYMYKKHLIDNGEYKAFLSLGDRQAPLPSWAFTTPNNPSRRDLH